MDIGLCGRLDYRTSGVMLMTDDAILNQAIRDPPRGSPDDEDGREEEEEEGGGGEMNEQPALCSDEDYQRYLRYKSKVYLVKVCGEKLNQLAAAAADSSQQLESFQNLVHEIASPFSFSRHCVTRTTNTATITLLRYYQDDTLRNQQRPDRGWCIDLEVMIREGKHHQVRRMMKRMNLKVMSLCRISIASILRIDSVPQPGECRWIEQHEVEELYRHLLLSPHDRREEVKQLSSISELRDGSGGGEEKEENPPLVT
jgi:16S rRNA U516 pseudouridylate synthase RsuA-like enzyme